MLNIVIAENPKDLTQEEVDVIKTRNPSAMIKSRAYEKDAWFYYLSLPFMWLLIIYVMIKKSIYKTLNIPGPKTNTLFYDGLGRACQLVKENAATWKGMEHTYSYYLSDELTIQNIIDRIYLNCLNAQSLRNRLRLIKKELKEIILKQDKKEIRIISLACGKAEDLLENIVFFKKEGITVKAILVDLNQEALENARKIAIEKNIIDQIEFQNKDLSEINNIAKNFKPDIIEMMGFLEYIKTKEAIALIKKIRDSLEPNGIFITCNIAPNIEQHFLKWVINWTMIHRTPKELAGIAEKSGFNNIKIIYEPLKIHGILIAKK